jgi:hypothetical protein
VRYHIEFEPLVRAQTFSKTFTVKAFAGTKPQLPCVPATTENYDWMLRKELLLHSNGAARQHGGRCLFSLLLTRSFAGFVSRTQNSKPDTLNLNLGRVCGCGDGLYHHRRHAPQWPPTCPLLWKVQLGNWNPKPSTLNPKTLDSRRTKTPCPESPSPLSPTSFTPPPGPPTPLCYWRHMSRDRHSAIGAVCHEPSLLLAPYAIGAICCL